MLKNTQFKQNIKDFRGKQTVWNDTWINVKRTGHICTSCTVRKTNHKQTDWLNKCIIFITINPAISGIYARFVLFSLACKTVWSITNSSGVLVRQDWIKNMMCRTILNFFNIERFCVYIMHITTCQQKVWHACGISRTISSLQNNHLDVVVGVSFHRKCWAE